MTGIRRATLVAALTLGLASLTFAAEPAKGTKQSAGDHAAASVKPIPGKAATAPASMPVSAEAPAAVDSLALLERAVAKDSTKFEPLYRLGVMYIDRDRIPEAIQVLHRAVRAKPDHVGATVNLGAAYDAAGNPDAAQTYYRKALELAPGDAIATCRLATSLYAKTNYAEAITLLRQQISSNNAPCAYYYLAVAFADAGIYKDAIRMWKKVIELAPESSEATSAKESVDVLEKFIKNQ